MILLPVDDEQCRRIERAVARFSASWSAISDDRSATARKMVILCELIGGRSRTVSVLGLRDNTLDNYRHGRTEPRYSALEALARVAGVPVSLLAHDWQCADGELRIIMPPVTAEPRDGFRGFAEPPRDRGTGWSDGKVQPLPTDQEARNRFLAALPQGFLAGLDLNPADLLVVRAAGSSMSPTIPDGAPMLVDTADRALTDGCIYLFRTESDLLVRRVQRQPDGSLDLIADNARRYRSRSLAPEALEALDIAGRVRAVTALL